MGMLHRDDEDLHYSDSSHRWIAPPDIEQSVWEAGVRAHLYQHLATMGGPTKLSEPRERRIRRAPRQRRAASSTSKTAAGRATAAVRAA
jgi:hypothetical protein